RDRVREGVTNLSVRRRAGDRDPRTIDGGSPTSDEPTTLLPRPWALAAAPLLDPRSGPRRVRPLRGAAPPRGRRRGRGGSPVPDRHGALRGGRLQGGARALPRVEPAR